jgi:hypothetical protein
LGQHGHDDFLKTLFACRSSYRLGCDIVEKTVVSMVNADSLEKRGEIGFNWRSFAVVQTLKFGYRNAGDDEDRDSLFDGGE